ncbi:protein translocase SEC61 complex subunit gamma [Candidatus Bathyarchaeota archaeon RBG_13_38_9]|nr:MAG: protein translocase SEC61 complex subunit gamma [Candidatus Bathyarchaeota archaeon RBG_13_38_9]TRO60046.1 protein translocase SEC61 complex subunit gamma [Candidatus Bathyarchaeota archaeon]
MNIGQFIESTKRLIHASSKPSREEVWLLLRVSLLGIAIIGGIGFMVRILFLFLGSGAI